MALVLRTAKDRTVPDPQSKVDTKGTSEINTYSKIKLRSRKCATYADTKPLCYPRSDTEPQLRFCSCQSNSMIQYIISTILDYQIHVRKVLYYPHSLYLSRSSTLPSRPASRMGSTAYVQRQYQHWPIGTDVRAETKAVHIHLSSLQVLSWHVERPASTNSIRRGQV